ncbi:hypothetical protein [Noviherbaspirillum saxi]|uniref:Uncharacterized protein n=1 Tax=Noviherbaspirillum saxi TaxID=2320863 RepID=A0A3A3FUT2_9BURK|nr:hypothetical protein [Noviherbaspirillum saxi]RJF99084.1 hypothetical protein D3871_11580 [Noviherbaspirillum saxi]
MSVRTLEAERQAILERMRLRRENYRRMLTDGDELGQIPYGQEIQVDHSFAQSYTPALRPVPAHPEPPDVFPRSTIMRVLKRHPVYCALGVAAIIAIGPKRIARTAMTSGATLTALTARNQSNTDLIGRLITMAGAYMQGRSNTHPK